MGGRSSRVKGASAELEIARLVAPWWQAHDPAARFARTPASGGWGTKDLRAGFKASGDLMTTSVDFPFVIEVKRREAGSRLQTASGAAARHPAWSWWRQSWKAADEQAGEPLLIFRRNGQPWRIFLPSAYVRRTGLIGVLSPILLLRDPTPLPDAAPEKCSVAASYLDALLTHSALQRIVAHGLKKDHE